MPNSFSRDCICFEIADYDIKRFSVTSVKLPISTIVQKYVICHNNISPIVCFNFFIIYIIIKS